MFDDLRRQIDIQLRPIEMIRDRGLDSKDLHALLISFRGP